MPHEYRLAGTIPQKPPPVTHRGRHTAQINPIVQAYRPGALAPGGTLYGIPGSAENRAALSGLSFHSSASAGASPLRVMFGHCAA